jgi:hypothetical protein
MAMTVVTALPPPAPTHPGFLDAARLQALCSAEGPDAASARSLCLGYVTGAVDEILARSGRRGRAAVCPPADLTPKAALAVVMRHRRYTSTANGVGATDFVRFALERAYTCPIQRSRP